MRALASASRIGMPLLPDVFDSSGVQLLCHLVYGMISCDGQGWEKDMEEKRAVAHMYEDADVFQSSILEARQVEHAEEVRAAEERARQIHKQKKARKDSVLSWRRGSAWA